MKDKNVVLSKFEILGQVMKYFYASIFASMIVQIISKLRSRDSLGIPHPSVDKKCFRIKTFALKHH